MRTFLKIAAATTVALSFTVAAAKADALADVQQRGQLNVAIIVDFPPFGLLNVDNKPDGYDFDVATALAKDLGVKLNLVPTTAPNRIPYLLSEKVDIVIATLSVTQERAKQVLFTNPYAGIQTVVYGAKDAQIAKPEDLKGKSIGVARATTQDTSVTSLVPAGTDIKRFDDNASVIQALLSGQIQSMADANTVIAEVEKISGGRFETKFLVAQQRQAMAVRPGETAFADYVNAFIKRHIDDGSLEAMSKKWLGVPLPNVVTNPMN